MNKDVNGNVIIPKITVFLEEGADLLSAELKVYPEEFAILKECKIVTYNKMRYMVNSFEFNFEDGEYENTVTLNVTKFK